MSVPTLGLNRNSFRGDYRRRRPVGGAVNNFPGASGPPRERDINDLVYVFAGTVLATVLVGILLAELRGLARWVRR